VLSDGADVVPQSLQGSTLDLTYPLSSEAHRLSDVGHRSCVSTSETEVLAENVAFALIEDPIHRRLHVAEFFEEAGVGVWV